MSLILEHGTPANAGSGLGEEEDLRTRIQAEFREMPGLTLTLPQAARLFSIEPACCERVLGALVRAGRLTTDGRTFMSSTRGRRSACRRVQLP